MAKRVLVITPTYNEKENLPVFLKRVHEVYPEATVLVVDDASADGTGVLADHIATNDSRVQIIHRASKLGIGSAYLEGFAWALARDYEVIFQMDTDLSHDPRHMMEFLAAIDEGADLVIGSRNTPGGRVEGWGPLRHLLSKGGSWYSRIILGLKIRDLTSGYKAFRRETLLGIGLEHVHSEGYSFQIEMNYRAVKAKYKVREVPIVFEDRRAGNSKMSGKIFLEAVWMVWKLRFQYKTSASTQSHDRV